MIVYGTKTKRYTEWQDSHQKNTGAHFYAKEIEDIILPKLDLNLFIITAGAALYPANEVPDGAIAVCHDNRYTKESYHRLFRKGIVWVCSKQSTVDKLKSYGENAVYIPLSIDTRYVAKYKTKKTKDIAYVGNPWAFKADYLASLPPNIDQLSNMEREDLLKAMAKYRRVIAEGRCLMEAQVLGAECEVPKYENLESVFVEPLDSLDAVSYWAEALDGYETINVARVLVDFHDTVADVVRYKGDVFTAPRERLEEIAQHKLGLIELLG